MSLTRTLTLLVTSTVLVIALIAAAWSYVESNHELEELFDAELAQSTRIVQGLIRHLVGTQSPEELSRALSETLKLPAAALQEGDFNEILLDGSGHKYEKKIAFEVWSDTGSVMLDTLASDDNPELSPGYSWIESSGFQWRTFTLRDPETGFWIRTAQREDIRQELSTELAMGNVFPLLIVMPLLILAIVAAIRLGFRPLRKLEEPIRHMAPQNIHPLDDQYAPREVSGLVRAVNGLLGRLDDALDRERRFSTDAAHELRTPLAALRLNLEHAIGDNPQAFGDLIESVDRMGHLVEQMLVLSRIDSGKGFEWDQHDLADIVAQSVADVTPLAVAKGIEPVFENHAVTSQIKCNRTLINTLMRSVLANAIQYSPQNTVVTVTVETSDDGYLLSVCDQGPGILAEERDRALSRFTRLDQRAGSGSGLGLAIARRIAEMHGGSISLDNRPDGQKGLKVIICLWNLL
jgi:two-component system sensor histidine kinase QseC